MAQGIGIKLPIRLGNIGYFEQTFTTLEEAKANLTNLLLTNKGERPMQAKFGADISKLLFENNVEGLDDIIERNIQQAIDFWLPYINIQEIVVDTSSERVDENKILITITFGVSQIPNRFETIILTF
jgi:phage baseplate assembly protein W